MRLPAGSIRVRLVLLLAGLISLNTTALAADDLPDPLQQVFTELAPGIWLGNRPDSTRLPVTPNTTFVIGDEGVVVFDGGNLPLVAVRVIAKIRELTDQPVTHVIASHWHMDHVLGLAQYRAAFPDVQLIAHPYTRELMVRYLAKNEQNMRNTVPDNLPGIQAMLEAAEKGEGKGLDAQTEAWFRQFVDHADLLDQQYQGFEIAYPNLTVSDQLTIHSGDCEIVILHPGTGNTPGDLVLWLPAEKILLSGDIVVWPTPYGHGGHATEWAETLDRIAAMDWRVLVPGHGEVQADRTYLELLAATLRSISSQMETLAASGISQDEAAKRLDLAAFEGQFTGGKDFLKARFREWFVSPIASAAWLLAREQDPEIVGSE